MIAKNIVIFLIFVITLEVTGINNIWGENIHRRILHHLQRNKYNPNKKPWIHFLNNALDNETMNYILSLEIDKKNCIQTISPIMSKLLGGNYSKKCTLYYNDFSKEAQKKLDAIGNSMIPKLEKIAGEKLSLGNSDFRCVLLRYEGSDANFTMHYDTEPKNCYRTLFLIKKRGNPPPFIYYDKNKKRIEKYLDEGNGIFFQGTKTYHGVGTSNDPNMVRYMIGWQYSTDNNIKDESICSKTRGKTPLQIVGIFLPYIVLTLTASLLLAYITKFKTSQVNIKILLSITFLTFILNRYLPLLTYKIPIGTGLYSGIKALIVITILSFISFGNIAYSLIFLNYLLLTEMFLPRSWVNKKLKEIEH